MRNEIFPKSREIFQMPEGKKVQKMFAKIASRYDLANNLLSGGVCKFWARKLANFVARERPNSVADLATGSGDIAFLLSKKLVSGTTIRAFDFCEEMLEVARERQKKCGGKIEFSFGDCMNLPLGNAEVDAVTIAYGIRNFENRARGLSEIHRILKPGGKAFILEFTQPAKIFRPFYFLYLKFALPIFAKIITGDKTDYDYLTASIEAFPKKEKISEELGNAGFSNVRAVSLTFSIVAIHIAEKK